MRLLKLTSESENRRKIRIYRLTKRIQGIVELLESPSRPTNLSSSFQIARVELSKFIEHENPRGDLECCLKNVSEKLMICDCLESIMRQIEIIKSDLSELIERLKKEDAISIRPKSQRSSIKGEELPRNFHSLRMAQANLSSVKKAKPWR